MHCAESISNCDLPQITLGERRGRIDRARNGSLNNKRRGEVLRFIGPLLLSYLPSLALVHPGIFGVCVLLVARWALMTKIACLAYRHRVKQSSLLSPSCSYFRSPFSRPATLFKGLQDTLVLEADVKPSCE